MQEMGWNIEPKREMKEQSIFFFFFFFFFNSMHDENI